MTKNIPESDIKIIADAMYKKNYKKGEYITTFGDIGEESFVLDSGNIEVLVYNEGTYPKDPNLS